jgi:hypothetical protein
MCMPMAGVNTAEFICNACCDDLSLLEDECHGDVDASKPSAILNGKVPRDCTTDKECCMEAISRCENRLGTGWSGGLAKCCVACTTVTQLVITWMPLVSRGEN